MASVCFRRYLNFSRGLLSSWRPRGARPGSWSRGALCYRPACRSSSCRSPPLRRPSPVDSRPSAACTIPTAAHNAETTRRAREVRPQRLDDPVRSSPRSLMEPTICLEASRPSAWKRLSGSSWITRRAWHTKRGQPLSGFFRFCRHGPLAPGWMSLWTTKRTICRQVWQV